MDSSPNPVDPVMLSPEDIVQQLRAMRTQIPLPETTSATAAPVTPGTPLRRRLGHVNADFVQASINAAGASEVVQKALGRSDEDLRQETDASARWTAVADELRALLQSVVTSILTCPLGVIRTMRWLLYSAK